MITAKLVKITGRVDVPRRSLELSRPVAREAAGAPALFGYRIDWGGKGARRGKVARC